MKRLNLLLAAAVLALVMAGGAAAASYTDTADLPAWAGAAVEYMTARGLMEGMGDGRFAPWDSADRAMVTTLLWRMAGSPAAGSESVFVDVESGQWYSEAIGWAAGKGIVEGDGVRFSPFDQVTRQDLAVILYRYAGSPSADVSVLSRFLDYTQVSGYAANALSWAVTVGIMQGDGTSIHPKDGASRVELAALFMGFEQKALDKL